MSVDVFGRVLDNKRGGSGARGPPGEGFQRTPDGDFDINRKRLCNVAAPLEESDAVNLHTLRGHLQNKTSLDEVKEMVESVREKFEETARHWDADFEGIKSLVYHNAQFIGQLAGNVKSHVRTGEAGSGGGAPQTRQASLPATSSGHSGPG